jgi:hypothetical protein
MGLGILSSSSSDKSFSTFSKWKKSKSNLGNNNVKNLPNPKPNNYKIVKELQIKDYLIIQIKYLDCTNYEGNKILVFRSTLKNILNRNKGLIDPHFSDNKKFISPIARFRPTSIGWNDAINFVKTRL